MAQKTCLIVDDSRTIRKIARQIIETFNFICDEADDGVPALEYCKQQFPDMILLDWNMPVMSGFDFMMAMRALPGGDKPVIIFCTTENEFAQIAKAIGGGANEYIMKPFDADILKDKLIQTGLLEG